MDVRADRSLRFGGGDGVVFVGLGVSRAVCQCLEYLDGEGKEG